MSRLLIVQEKQDRERVAKRFEYDEVPNHLGIQKAKRFLCLTSELRFWGFTLPRKSTSWTLLEPHAWGR